MQRVQFVETVLRDANQSLIATRLPYDKFEPILETMDKAGFYSVECWGGATFDVCLRYLNEDPWERLRKIRAKMPNTKLQMLLRGQNVLGYKHYPDDVVRKFVQCSVSNGIDIIRIFDALNDSNNLKVAIEETVKCGAIASGTISYTTSPVHTLENYVKLVKEMKEMGASTICIKDMAGIMGPKEAYDLVSAIKDAVDMPVDLHTHSTTGLAFMTELKAVEAGCDIVDTAISPFSGGTSQPATETMAYALRQLGYQVDLDDKVLKEMADFFKPIRDGLHRRAAPWMPKSMATDTQCLTYQIPGGMLSNLLSQLKMMNALDRFDEALIETPEGPQGPGLPPAGYPDVPDGRRAGGHQCAPRASAIRRSPTRSRPTAAANTAAPPRPCRPRGPEEDPGRREAAGGAAMQIRWSPPSRKTKAELGDTARCDEDVLSYIAFPQLAEKFFEERKAREENIVTYTIEEA